MKCLGDGLDHSHVGSAVIETSTAIRGQSADNSFEIKLDTIQTISHKDIWARQEDINDDRRTDTVLYSYDPRTSASAPEGEGIYGILLNFTETLTDDYFSTEDVTLYTII